MRPVPFRVALGGLLLATAAACGSSSSGAASGQMGSMSVHLVDGPGDFQEVNLHVLEVSVHSNVTGWTTLSKPDKTYDLLKLRDGVFATLAAGVPLPAGDYAQVRLLLGAGNTVRLADGSLHDLTVPSGLQSGLKIVCPTHLSGGASRDVFIDLDGQKSVFLHDTGTGAWILRPVVRCQETTGGTGSIAGQLTSLASESSQPLPGAVVTAQTIGAGGVPTVVRTATTGLDGRYLLDLLPLGANYYVVTQPVVGPPGALTAYAARASGPLPLSALAPSATYGVVYAQAAVAGAASGTVTPTATASDADVVSATQPLLAGLATHEFVVRSAAAAVASGVERYAMPALPEGTYSLSVTRRTLAGGVETVTTGAARSAVVTAGATATVDLTVP